MEYLQSGVRYRPDDAYMIHPESLDVKRRGQRTSQVRRPAHRWQRKAVCSDPGTSSRSHLHFPIGQADVSARRTYGLQPAAADPGHRLALRQAAQQALQILRSLHRDLDPPVSLAALSVETISSYALRRLVPVINAKRHTPPACQLYSSYPFGACGGAVGYGAAVDRGAK